MMICKSKMIFWIFLCSPLIVKAKDEFDDFFEFSDDPHPTEVLIDEFAHTIQLANGLSTQLEDKVKESPANNEIETLTVQLNDVTQEMSSVMSGVMIKAMKEGTDPRDNQNPFAVTEAEAKKIIALTYGMITMIDDAIGRVLKRLDDLGLAENTIVIFTSDHGDYMGDHGLMLKLLLHYQGTIRVPFVWHDPRQPAEAERNDDLGSSIDISASILAQAGIQPFNGIQGRDLFNSEPPEAIIVEEDSQRLMIGFDKPQRVRTLVTKNARMSLRQDEDWDELYDLSADPDECRNLYDDPAAAELRNKMNEIMLRKMISLQDRAPLPAYRA